MGVMDNIRSHNDNIVDNGAVMISIVIPVYNQKEMTEDCLAAIKANTQDYEVVIIDNGSDPPLYWSDSSLDQGDRLIIRNETNLGFPAAINQGMRAAKGDTIILLNNDIVVTPGWAFWLQKALEDYSIVGPVTNYAAGIQEIAFPAYDNLDELNAEAEKWSKKHAGEVKEVRWVIGFCMAFKRSLAEELGWWDGDKYKYFDESLWPCCGEEIDFCLRAKAVGHKIGIAWNVYVHHHGTVTIRKMEEDGEIDTYKQLCARNEKHLRGRWGDEVWYQQRLEEKGSEVIRLNLGCGLHKKQDGIINIDNRPEVEPDLLCDVTKGLPYSDNSIGMIYALDFLEHLERHEVVALMDEIYRVLKPGGKFQHLTPSDEGRGAWQDPTHKSAWNINTWRFYFVEPEFRDLYGTIANFKIVELYDKITNSEYNIIHTHCVYEAVK